MRCRFPHPGQISKGARGSTCNAAPGRFGSWEITVRDPYKIAACFPCRNPWQLSESLRDRNPRRRHLENEAAASVSRAQYGEEASRSCGCLRRHRPASICAGKRRNSWGLFFFWRGGGGGGGGRGREEEEEIVATRRHSVLRPLRLRHDYPAPPTGRRYLWPIAVRLSRLSLSGRA